MLADHWPLAALTLTTPRLVLRPPTEEELVGLAAVAAGGIHAPHERPFLTPWTEGGPRARAESVLRGHWDSRATWDPASWRLQLVVLRSGTPVGSVTLRAQDFGVVREVSTSSWLGLAHQRQGFGTEARVALLTLAFDHLGAESACTEVFQDNRGSQGVSRRLGYQPDGISRDARGEEVLVSDRLRLSRERWAATEHVPVAVTGLDACRGWFGV